MNPLFLDVVLVIFEGVNFSPEGGNGALVEVAVLFQLVTSETIFLVLQTELSQHLLYY